MERKFQINWPALIEEAKQRRKKQKLTQQRLADLAKVSAPTVSHFENGEKDIQLSTILKIFEVLGMVDERHLVFLESKTWYDHEKDEVRFKGKDGDKIILCRVELEVLADHFSEDDRNAIKIFQANRERIEHEVRRKYLAGEVKADGSVLVKTSDL